MTWRGWGARAGAWGRGGGWGGVGGRRAYTGWHIPVGWVDTVRTTRYWWCMTFLLHGVDGDTAEVTDLTELGEGVDVDAIEALDVGETYRDGGGAQPEWSITRLS